MEVEIPFVRGDLLEKMSRLTYYINARAMIATLDEQIENTSDELVMFSEKAGNPDRSEGSLFQAKKHRLSIMQRQRDRLMDRLTELELQIRSDMDSTE